MTTSVDAGSPSRRAPAKFVIWAPPFDDTKGGAIALHLLCHRLNRAGETALLWPPDRPLLRFPMPLRRLARWLLYVVRREDRRFVTGPFGGPIAHRRDLDGAIVLYPEIIAGNPLCGRHVVRWMLHKPGHFTGQTGYGKDELHFHILEAFRDPDRPEFEGNKLSVVWTNEAYRDKGYKDRSGSCYLLKKGAGRTIVHDLADSVLIDDMSPEEKAEEFNRRERFYCYDLYTMYSQYAALCGCLPIVVPEPGMSKEDWHPLEVDRYGVAYGEEDIGWALASRDNILDWLRDRTEAEHRMLTAFIAKCKDWYPSK